MKKVFHQALTVANSDATVLITGESGTGKEVVARTIHYHGSRAANPFIPINCTAIPEGLPVALTVALAIGMNRMSRRNVIVRRLIAVEALGSCTYIASDKTGTLTLNELTARRLVLPDASQWRIGGEGIAPDGRIEALDPAQQGAAREALIRRLAKAVSLANEGFLGHRDGDWSAHGDAVDIALLVMARKAGLNEDFIALAANNIDRPNTQAVFTIGNPYGIVVT